MINSLSSFRPVLRKYLLPQASHPLRQMQNREPLRHCIPFIESQESQMKAIKTNHFIARCGNVTALLALTASSMIALGQYQVGGSNDARVNTYGGAIDPQVSKELYGNNTSNGSIRYSGSQRSVMPSEVRYAAIRSGSLPSEIKAQANAIGPLPPGGALSYIPGYDPAPQPIAAPAPMSSPEVSMGSVRYQSVPHSWTSAPTPTRLESPNLNPGPMR